MITLIKLSENDKRIIFAVLLLIVLTLVLIGYLGMLITRIIRHQGKKLDYYIADPVTTRVITTPKHFVKYARKKNAYLFYKKARWPVLLIIFSILLLVINNIWAGWDYNPFTDTEKGFGSILFIWDLQSPDCWTQLFGSPFYLLTSWPPLVHYPEFNFELILVYLFVILFYIGLFWYLHHVTSYIARGLRIHKLKNSIFSKNLDNFTLLNTVPPKGEVIPPQQNSNNNVQ